MVRKAEERLKKAGLKVGSVKEEFSDKDEKGTVISQEPQAKSKITKGKMVDFVILPASSQRIETNKLDSNTSERNSISA